MSEENGKKLPSGWAEVAIDELLFPLDDGRTLHQGWSPQCEKVPSPTDEIWGVLKTTAIQAGAFLPEHNKRLPATLDADPTIEVHAGDLLITCAGPRVRCGVACLIRSTRPRLMMSGKMYRFRVSPSLFDSRYLEAFLLTPRATLAIDKIKTGSSDSGLNLTHDRFRTLRVPVAPISEQHRIAEKLDELLSDLDAGMKALEGVRAKLKRFRVSVLKAAVDGTLTAEWRCAAPGHRTRRPTPRTHPRRTPPTLGEIATREVQGSGEGGTEGLEREVPGACLDGREWFARDPRTLAVDHTRQLDCRWAANGAYFPATQYGNGAAILRIDDYQNGWIRDADALKRVAASADEVANYALNEGDLVINRVNSMTHLGKCLSVPRSHVGVLFESNMMRAGLANTVSGKWVEVYLHSFPGRRRLTKNAKWAVNQASVNQSDVRCTPIPLPPLEEQLAIAEAVEAQLSVVDHLESDVDAELKRAAALQQSILKSAFEGMLVPQDPSDEPAPELLKRIAAERADRERLVKKAKAASKKAAKPANGGKPKRTTKQQGEARGLFNDR